MLELSVCLIVKNESEVLARCLNCAKKFADEIVVVDTGSTDNTKEIAKKYTNNIFDFVWVDDFSKARNFSFSKATKKYVMWLDADDFILKKDINKIIELKKSNKNADCFMFKYNIAFDENNRPIFSYFRERIFKREKNFEWKGYIHEAIAPSGEIQYEDISICHMRKKSTNLKRNLLIYEKHINNGEKLDTRSIFYYARELYYNKKYKKAIKFLKLYLKKVDKYFPNEIDSYNIMSNCYLLLNNKLMALSVLVDSIKICFPNAEICCKIGEILNEQNKKDDAIMWYKTALVCDKNITSGAFVQAEYYDIIPYLQLSYLHYYKNDYEKAKYYYNCAKKINPKHKIVLLNQKYFTK